MKRNILALAAGLVTAWAIIVIDKLIAIGGWPTGSALEFMTRNEITAYFSSQPLPFYMTLLIGSVLGGFFGSYIASNMSRRENRGFAMPLVVAVFLILGAMVNFFVLFPGQPVWLMVATIGLYLPVTLLARKLAY
ncbi:MAG TPA: hypothetical protein PLP21_13250 [Pyrinomonadaceae bacterium]|nr:hypothetical protein [Acidobacteriota bacterium]HQZ97282.1 hypothetical protein [Pyrinomonadaceae bacterium]